MSTPIFLSESIPLELRNILKSFEKGMRVKTPDGDEGYIDFISDQYITIVVIGILVLLHIKIILYI